MPIRISKNRVLLDGVPLNEGKGADVASAVTVDIWSGSGNLVPITGTATISAFTVAPQAGAKRTLLCVSTPIFTNGANFLLPGSANYTATAGDRIEVLAITTTQFRLSVLRASAVSGVTEYATKSVFPAVGVVNALYSDKSTGMLWTWDTVTSAYVSVADAGTYLGQVATRCYIPKSVDGNYRQSMTRTTHVARDTISSIQVIFPNFYCDSQLGELDAGNVSITASIEYPVGVYNQLKFSGAVAGHIPTKSYLASDPLTIFIPDGARFFVKNFWVGTSAVLQSVPSLTALAPTIEACQTWLSGGVDSTMSNTSITATNSGLVLGPVAIIGKTAKDTYWLAGDSRMIGINDPPNSINGGVGEVERAIQLDHGYINAGLSGERLYYMNFNAGWYTNRLALSQYCSKVISNLGINDCLDGWPWATPEVCINYFADTKFAGKPVYWATLTPNSTSTDSFTTLANQAPNFTNGTRISINNTIRAGGYHLAGYFEVADVVESARNSGLWKAPGYTTDGLHGTALGNTNITPSIFTQFFPTTSPVSIAGPAAQTITVGVSPFVYTAASAGEVIVTGGTVSAVSITRGSTVVPAGMIAGIFPLRANDKLTVTYSAAPVMTMLPN